ncbi:hypothetical protein IWX90DRAFT_126516 [Phyllosticta citrichinensis]|uniref:Uncharacterized protein n=1 Tax=Phyllosticta citrichinensis TaxID=1130410 RepID=A0ABR1Y440_9PEZI
MGSAFASLALEDGANNDRVPVSTLACKDDDADRYVSRGSSTKSRKSRRVLSCGASLTDGPGSSSWGEMRFHHHHSTTLTSDWPHIAYKTAADMSPASSELVPNSPDTRRPVPHARSYRSHGILYSVPRTQNQQLVYFRSSDGRLAVVTDCPGHDPMQYRNMLCAWLPSLASCLNSISILCRPVDKIGKDPGNGRIHDGIY